MTGVEGGPIHAVFIRAPVITRTGPGVQVLCTLADGRVVDGVASLGVRPMYALETPLLEVWLFDFDGDLYGQTLDTQLIVWLRGEETFDGLDAPTLEGIAADRRALTG